MTFINRETVVLTTDGSGDAVGYTGEVNGFVQSISYVKDDFADGVDFTITTETTLQNLWVDTNINASEVVYPRVIGSDPAGAAITDPKYFSIPAVKERIKIVVAQGGDTKSGTFHVIIG